ncbi:MAG: DUF2254 domain-containing protein [Isosphaeraceae bacterium]
MKIWLASKWDELRANFWFVPSVMVSGAVALSLATIRLDKATASRNWIATLGWTFTRGPEGSRAVLSTVAGSMMTITSITFSITIVALQLASSQFGPRLLRNFMRDRGNQVALGTFIATFAYCLLILRTINGTDTELFVPHISVTVGLLMALFSLGVLIFFIHHAAESIQAENVIAAVSRDLRQAIDRLYPDGQGDDARESSAGGQQALPADFERSSRPIAAPSSDYLQAIDVDGLVNLANDRDLIISVVNRPGEFIFEGSDLVRIWPGDRVDDDLNNAVLGAFYFGRQRTLAQDVGFAIDQLVEVAVRALSPGVNDPFTAINCVDRLGAALCVLGAKEMPPDFRLDDDGRLRVVTDSSTASGIINASFHQIRQAARGDAAVTIRLLEAIAAIAGRTRDPDFLAALRRHADMIHRGSLEGLPEKSDREDADDRYRRALDALDASGLSREVGDQV